MSSVITDELRSFVGVTSPPITYRVTHREIVRFNAAIRGVLPPIESDPSDVDVGVAVANPLFLRSLLSVPYEPPFPEPFHDVLDGGSKFTFHRPIRAGDEITVVRELIDIFEKSGRLGTMLFKVSVVSYRDAAGELVATQESTGISYGRVAGSV